MFTKIHKRQKSRRRKRLNIKAKSNSPFLAKSRANLSCKWRDVQIQVVQRRDQKQSSITTNNKYHSEPTATSSPTNQLPPVMLRSNSTSTYSSHKTPTTVKDFSNSKMKRSKSTNSSNKVKTKMLKGLCEAEIQRKKRVAAYNVYGVEGRVKGSVKKSFKWFKETCSNLVYNLW